MKGIEDWLKIEKKLRNMNEREQTSWLAIEKSGQNNDRKLGPKNISLGKSYLTRKPYVTKERILTSGLCQKNRLILGWLYFESCQFACRISYSPEQLFLPCFFSDWLCTRLVSIFRKIERQFSKIRLLFYWYSIEIFDSFLRQHTFKSGWKI